MKGKGDSNFRSHFCLAALYHSPNFNFLSTDNLKSIFEDYSNANLKEFDEFQFLIIFDS